MVKHCSKPPGEILAESELAPWPYAGHFRDHSIARAAASTMVPTHCPPHISLPPTPRCKCWSSTGRSHLELESPVGSPLFCLFDSSQPLSTFIQCGKSPEWLGLLLTSIKLTGHTLSSAWHGMRFIKFGF